MQITGNVQGMLDLIGGGVQDVKVDGVSVVNDQGIAQITLTDAPVQGVEVDGVSVVNDQGVAEITLPDAPVQGVEVDGVSVVNEQGVAEITLPDAPVQGVEVDGVSVVNDQGIAEITLPDNGVHYSTSEQEIGTWIDGKILYEKTLFIESISSGSNTINHQISNLDKIVEAKGTFFATNNSSPIPNGNIQSGWLLNMYDFGATSFVLNVGSSWVQYFNSIVVTLRYTKS